MRLYLAECPGQSVWSHLPIPNNPPYHAVHQTKYVDVPANNSTQQAVKLLLFYLLYVDSEI